MKARVILQDIIVVCVACNSVKNKASKFLSLMEYPQEHAAL